MTLRSKFGSCLGRSLRRKEQNQSSFSASVNEHYWIPPRRHLASLCYNVKLRKSVPQIFDLGGLAHVYVFFIPRKLRHLSLGVAEIRDSFIS
jgi:hypothetical protein